MEWNKQMEEMMNAWTETQRRMWENWLETMKQAARDMPSQAGAPGADYKAQLEAWEKSVHQALEAQSEWARRLSEQGGAARPEGMDQWTQQMQEMMKGWTDAQKKLWDAWLGSVQQMNPGAGAADWEKEGRKVLEAWQQAAERAQETMLRFSQASAPGESGSSGKGTSKKK